MPQAPLSSSSSTRTSVLSSACSTPSTPSSSNLEEEQVHLLGRDGILGKKGDRLSNSELGELSSNLVKNFVYDSVAPGTLKVYKANCNCLDLTVNFLELTLTNMILDFLFICNFMIYRLQRTSSLSSVLSA